MIAGIACQWSGVPMTTASTDLAANTFRKSTCALHPWFAPYLPDTRLMASSKRTLATSAMETTRQSAWPRKKFKWLELMRPKPMKPKLILSLGLFAQTREAIILGATTAVAAADRMN